jgi:chaperonin cofactor prefoldin
MDNFTYDNFMYPNQAYPGIDSSVPELGNQQFSSFSMLDDAPYYTEPNGMYKQVNPVAGGVCRHQPLSTVKTEQNPGLYTHPHTPAQFQLGDTAFFGNRGHYMSGSPSGPPVSPYGNHSVSEGTVSSTVSSPRSPHGFSLPREDEDVSRVSDDQLTQMSARDLNKYFKEYSPTVISQLKKKRRTLKNRGYALNSRMKRVQQKTELEVEKINLQDQVKDLNTEVEQLKKELDSYKRKVATLEGLLTAKPNSR